MITLKINGESTEIGGGGITFIPSVSQDGELSWTNNGGLENPEPVNIKGPQGERGDDGVVLDIYSTGETRVGTWIDGKPVYRKVIQTTSTGGRNEAIDVNVADLNCETFITLKGFAKGGNNGEASGCIMPIPSIPYGTNGSSTGIWSINNGATIRYSIGQNGYLDSPIIIIAEYTKTTDQAT